ncbi:MAG: type II secretion system F family protein [Proteobacteria bacterium]|nr:type II secretion system F family protein [Pseudomonadota bacterium]
MKTSASPTSPVSVTAARPSRAELAALFSNLGTMLAAGLPLARSLDALAQQGATPAIQQTCATLLTTVERGKSLSAAVQQNRLVFSTMHSRTIEAGERTGRLPQVLTQLGAWEDRDLALIRTVSGSLTYPLTVFVCGVALVAILGDRVFATLTPMLRASGKTLPLLTQALCSMSDLLRQPLALALLALGGGATVWMLLRWARTEQGRYKVDRGRANVPVFGALSRKLFIARFCHHLSLLYAAGIPMLSALETCLGMIDNTWLRGEAEGCMRRLRNGATLTQSLAETGLLPRLALGMVEVGEQTGKMDVMLDKMAEIYDQEVYLAIDTMIQVLEPALITGMGVVVAVLVIAVLLPLYQVVGA